MAHHMSGAPLVSFPSIALFLVVQDPAIGQVSAEHYFEEVLEGARLIEAQCSKSIMFE